MCDGNAKGVGVAMCDENAKGVGVGMSDVAENCL